jgi:hypothetical protein
MNVDHLNAGARGSTGLVLDDADRFALLGRLVESFGDALLGYCLMDTHLHVLAEGQPARTRAALTRGLRAYARSFNARHAREGPLLRGPVEAIRAPGPAELARMLRYLHENPLRTRDPIVSREVDYVWSSARSFAGLSRAAFPNVDRMRALLGSRARPFTRSPVPLAGLEPARVPAEAPGAILAAAAQTFGVAPSAVAGKGLSPALVSARAVFVTLGRLESYRDSQLAPVLGRTRQRMWQLGAGEVDLDGVRIARTLLREPPLRSRLPG